MKVSRLLLGSAMVLALSACASTPSGGASSASNSGDCLHADRRFELVSVEDAHHAVVRARPGPTYRLTFSGQCAALAQYPDALVGFSNGPPIMLHSRHQGPVWANSHTGSSVICGHAGDRLTWRERSDGLDTPPRQCMITHVERVK